VRITVGANESQPLEASALLVGALNTPSYGGGLYLAPNAKIDDGNLDVILLEDLSLGQILKLLPALGFRGELTTPRLHRISTPHVRIETDPPCWFHGDGELLGLTPVDVAIVRKAVRVLCPDRNPRG
jgi:diacylglycerol kinase family enzyme